MTENEKLWSFPEPDIWILAYFPLTVNDMCFPSSSYLRSSLWTVRWKGEFEKEKDEERE